MYILYIFMHYNLFLTYRGTDKCPLASSTFNDSPPFNTFWIVPSDTFSLLKSDLYWTRSPSLKSTVGIMRKRREEVGELIYVGIIN